MPHRNMVTALIVDDEPVDLTFIQRILEVICGFKVLGSASFQEAVRTFEASGGQVDLLITDVSLPGKTGIELAQTLLLQKQDLKVLFISGWVGGAALRLQGVPPDSLHFLAKPFRYPELVKRVREVLASEASLSWLEPNGAR